MSSFVTPTKDRTVRRAWGKQSTVEIHADCVVKTYDWKSTTDGHGSDESDYRNCAREHAALERLARVDGVVNLRCDRRPYLVGTPCPSRDAPSKTIVLERLGELPLESLVGDGFQRHMRQIVSEIHAIGVSHNDIKVDNIMLREDQQPVLADFGLARSRAEFSAAGWIQQTAKDMEALKEVFELDARSARARRPLDSEPNPRSVRRRIKLPE